MKILKYFPLILSGYLVLILKLVLAPAALAHCPLCTAGAGMGLILSRWLGIDDAITGIWLAAFLGATALWFANSLKKKYIPYQSHVLYWFVQISTIWSFYAFKIVTPYGGMIMGIPKLIFGMAAGAIVFYVMDFVNAFVKRKRGKVIFPYQSIIFSLGSLLILSLGMFIFVTYYI